MDNSFSLYWWDEQDQAYDELRFVGVEQAISRAKTLMQSPAAKIGIIKRIIITDGDDYTNFEWKADEGIIFPKPTV